MSEGLIKIGSKSREISPQGEYDNCARGKKTHIVTTYIGSINSFGEATCQYIGSGFYLRNGIIY